MGVTVSKDRKAVLAEKLAAAAASIGVYGLTFVRISHSPGYPFFHYVCDDPQGGRHYLEVSIHERI